MSGASGNDSEVPDAFLCPISKAPMVDPVVALDGHTYERAEIERWFATGKQTSPMTNSAMNRALTPNHGLKSQIKEWQERSNEEQVKQMVVHVLAAVMNEPKRVKDRLETLAEFVQRTETTVPSEQLDKLTQFTAGIPGSVDALGAVRSACLEVANDLGARVRTARRHQRLANSAMAGARDLVAKLDAEIAAVEKKRDELIRRKQLEDCYVSGLEQLNRDCGTSVTQLEKQLCEFFRGSEHKTNDGRASPGDVSSKRKISDEEGDMASKRQKSCDGGTYAAGQYGTLTYEASMYHGIDPVRCRMLFEKAAAAGEDIAIAKCKTTEWGGYEVDLAGAVRLYRKAAEQGDASAQFYLGHCYHVGEGVSKDSAEAFTWCQRAADQGYALAQCNLGHFHRLGENAPKDLAEAARWYRKAAAQSYAPGQFYLGNCYCEGDGVQQDPAEAFAWYRKAAEQGFAPAQTSLGAHFFRLRKAAAKGDVSAQTALGSCCFKGCGMPKDAAEAVTWFRKAAEQDFAPAQTSIGHCYRLAEGVSKKDLAEAVTWYRKAAEQDFAPGQFYLGQCYHRGDGVSKKDPVEADRWYRKAAAQGHLAAQKKLRIR